MSAKERYLAVLKREKPDRLPMDYWATPEATHRLCEFMRCDFEEVARRLHIDKPYGVAGRYVGPPIPQGQDIFGVKTRPVNYGTGIYEELVYSPLAQYNSVDEIEANYNWPNPDWWDYSHLKEEATGLGDKIVVGGGSEPFLRYKLLRGEQQAFTDLLVNPDIVTYCLDKLFNLAYENTRRIMETIPGVVNIVYVAEDLGGQTGLMFSLEQIRHFLFPGMKKMIDLTRQNGAFVFTHSDGAIRDVIPDLIQLGTQVLNPIQWRCPGMDRQGLKRDFGDRLVFHGAVDNQQTLPFGTVDDVRKEVAENIAILNEGGGYILAPCHNIQPITPPENIVAMYETGYELGWM